MLLVFPFQVWYEYLFDPLSMRTGQFRKVESEVQTLTSFVVSRELQWRVLPCPEVKPRVSASVRLGAVFAGRLSSISPPQIDQNGNIPSDWVTANIIVVYGAQ